MQETFTIGSDGYLTDWYT